MTSRAERPSAGETSDWAALRKSLWPLSWVYSGVVSARNGLFHAGWKAVHRLPVPVVSIGNLTVGGTGKTPLTILLVEALRARGHRPGVLARGYGRATGQLLNDEGQLLAKRCAELPQVQNPDRVAGGRELLDHHDVDIILLDDGFQHRRLHRDRDVVCLDAARPFDNWLTLPAGMLREAPRGLRRADVVVLTRAGRLGEEDFAARQRRIRQLAQRELPVLRADHEPASWWLRPGGTERPLEAFRGQRVGLVSAIAKPQSFEATVAGLGAEIVWHRRFRDHHRFSPADASSLRAAAEQDQVQLVMTEKDDVKFAAFDVPRAVLRIELRFLAAEEDPLSVLLGDVLESEAR